MLHSIARIFTDFWRDVSKSKETGQKNQEKTEREFSVFRFLVSPLYPTGNKIGSKWLEHVLKHAELQSQTRGVQSPEPMWRSHEAVFGLEVLQFSLSSSYKFKSN